MRARMTNDRLCDFFRAGGNPNGAALPNYTVDMPFHQPGKGGIGAVLSVIPRQFCVAHIGQLAQFVAVAAHCGAHRVVLLLANDFCSLRQLKDGIRNGPSQPARKERRQSNGDEHDTHYDLAIETEQFQERPPIICPQVKDAKLIRFLNDRLGEQQAAIGETAISRLGKPRQSLSVFRYSVAGENGAVGHDQRG